MKILPDAALNQHIAVLGKTGSGKTYAAKGIVERLLRLRRQTCIIDPTGAWWGLRLAADGKSKGLDVILIGGDHGDVPLAERSGAAVARLVTEQGASVVLDTSGLTVGEYTRWFIDFAGTLYTTLRNPLHLVIDEAHYFMPQAGGRVDIDTGKMIHAGNRLMSGGRSRGIRGMLITQRPAKLHKDSLTCADTLIAMRVTAPQDRGAYQDWIDGCGDPKQGKAVIDSLATLKRGEGWVWYPEGGYLERISFPAISTYDSSAAPVHGSKAAPKVSEIDLGEVQKALAEAVKEAEANDPKILRKKIAELERHLRERPTAAPVEPKVVEVPVITDQQIQEMRNILNEFEEGRKTTQSALNLFMKVGETWQKAIDYFTNRRAANEMLKIHRVPSRPRPATAQQRMPRPSSNGDGATIPIGERKTLAACIQFPNGLRREQLTVLTGYKRSSRDAYIQRLREKGYIVAGDKITATDAGIAALPDFEPLPRGEALQSYWLQRLPVGEKAMLEQLIATYPQSVQRDQLSESTGYQRSSRDAYLQRLRAKELIEEPSRGEVLASGDLFEER